MKICVFSDSHGNPTNMKTVIRRENPDLVFFLGDGEHDLSVIERDRPDLPILAVRGNCDFYSELPLELVTNVGEICFFLTHGHRYGVKSEWHFETLKAAARQNQAQVALFGHTHEAHMEQDGELLVMNPGSIRGYSPSCGILEIRDGKVQAGIVNL